MQICLDDFYKKDIKTIFSVPIKNTELWATYMIVKVKTIGRVLLNLDSGETVWPIDILSSKPIDCRIINNFWETP